jgi:hypothetical protein
MIGIQTVQKNICSDVKTSTPKHSMKPTPRLPDPSPVGRKTPHSDRSICQTHIIYVTESMTKFGSHRLPARERLQHFSKNKIKEVLCAVGPCQGSPPEGGLFVVHMLRICVHILYIFCVHSFCVYYSVLSLGLNVGNLCTPRYRMHPKRACIIILHHHRMLSVLAEQVSGIFGDTSYVFGDSRQYLEVPSDVWRFPEMQECSSQCMQASQIQSSVIQLQLTVLFLQGFASAIDNMRVR